jgi:hypothetical protein
MQLMRSVVVLICLCGGYPAVSAAENEELAKYYLLGMRDSRSQLVSGHVVLEGTRYHKKIAIGPTGPLVKGDSVVFEGITAQFPIRIDCVFDGRSLRFIRSPDRLPGGAAIITDDAVISKDASSGIIVKSSSGDQSQTLRIAPFDPRAFGSMTLFELETGKSEDWLDELLKDAQVVEVKEDNGIGRISWVFRIKSKLQSEVKRTIHIDSKKGFSPIRLEERSRPPGVVAEWSDIPYMDAADITWSNLDDVWVPTACRMMIAYGSQEVTYNLDWKEVNGQVPLGTFTIAEMKPADGTYIVDNRLGTPIVESVVGRPAKVDAELSLRRREIRILVVLVNFVIIILLASLVVYRRYTRARS